MYRLLFSLLATVLVLACGLVHGYWTDRWYPPKDTVEAAARLEQVPLTVGEWDGHDLDVKATSIEPLLAGHMTRRYVNRVNGETISIALVVGRPGPVSIHTPDVCYTAGGFVITSQSTAKVPGRNEEFLTMDAVKTTQTSESRIRLYWAWNAGQGWVTAGDPRTAFAHHRVLYKLYVTRDQNNLGEPSREDPCVSFMESLLPVLDQTLFGAGS
jgi:hypothetical protein